MHFVPRLTYVRILRLRNRIPRERGARSNPRKEFVAFDFRFGFREPERSLMTDECGGGVCDSWKNALFLCDFGCVDCLICRVRECLIYLFRFMKEFLWVFVFGNVTALWV